MKKKLKIPKAKLSGNIDYSAVIRDLKYGGYSFELQFLEELKILGGRLCVFDAFSLFSSCKPFDTLFPERGLPYTMEVFTNKGKKIAFSGIRFRDVLPVKWRVAVFSGDDFIKLQSQDGEVGTSISSGYACYGSVMALRAYESLVKQSDSIHPLEGFIDKNSQNATDKCTLHLKNNLSAAVFSAGWGDGFYKSFIGYGEGGEIVNFITDYEMITPDFKETQLEEIEAEISIEESYTPDPHISDTQNHIAKWSLYIDSAKPEDTEALFNAYSRRGYAYHSDKKYVEALNDYLAALALTEKMDKDNPCKIHAWTLYDNAGTIYRQLGQTQRAIEIFTRAKNCQDTFYSGAYSNLIDIYLSEKNLEKALQVALQMKCDRSGDANAFHRCAEIYVSMEDYESAIKEYDVLIDRFMLSEYIFEKVACLSSLNRYDEAKLILEKYLIENKANELYYYNLGLIKFRQKDYKNSHADLLRAYEINPDFVPCLHLLVEIDELFFNYQNITKWAGKYIELRPGAEFGYSVRAQAYFKLKNYDYALSDLDYIIDHISRDAKYYAYIIAVLAAKKEYLRAKKYLKFLKKNHAAYYYHSLGVLLMSQNKMFKAEKFLRAAYAKQQTDSFFFSVIDCFIKSQKYQKAREYLNRFAMLMADNAEFYQKKVNVSLLMKDNGSATRAADAYILKFLGENVSKEITDTIYKAMGIEGIK